MHRVPRLAAVAAVAASAIVAAAILAVTAGGQTPSAAPADFTVTSTIRDRDSAFVNNPPRRQSAGDVFLATGRITGAKRGAFEFTCTLVSRRASLCSAAATFSDGSIYLTARIAGEERVLRAAIVGGTGAYNGATGTLISTTTSTRGGREVSEDIYDFAP
jgi:hypothetical protein